MTRITRVSLRNLRRVSLFAARDIAKLDLYPARSTRRGTAATEKELDSGRHSRTYTDPNEREVRMKNPNDDPQDIIARRAYELFEERGREDGHDLDDWLQAERELQTQPASATARRRQEQNEGAAPHRAA